MAEVKKQKSGSGKKSFFEVEAPMTATKIFLYGGSLEEFEGKTVTLDLTKSLRGKSLELKMKVNLIDGKLKAIPLSLILAGSYIRRMMRRGTDYVEDAFDIECRDVLARIKPFMITRKNVSRSIRNALRITAKKYIESNLKIRTAKEIFSEIITNKFPRGLALKLKKIYPLALCEIRAFEIKQEKSGGRLEDGRKEKIEVVEGVGLENLGSAENLDVEEKKRKKIRRIEEEGEDKEEV